MAATWPEPAPLARNRRRDGDSGSRSSPSQFFTKSCGEHVHLKDLGQLVAREVEAAGAVQRNSNTIAVERLAWARGMPLFAPSLRAIADSVEYRANAHCADELCASPNCDKITPAC